MPSSSPLIARAQRAFVVACLAAILAPAGAQTPIPIATFFASAEIGEVRLSPNGRHMAMTVAGREGRMALAVSEIDTPGQVKVVADDAQLDIRSFRWVNDDWLVFNLIDLQSGLGDQRFGPGLLSVRRDGAEPRLLISTSRWSQQEQTGTNIIRTVLNDRHQLLFVPEGGGTEVIVGEYTFDTLGELINIVPKRLDVRSGRATPVVSGFPNHAVYWLFDRTGEPRLLETRSQGVAEVFWRDKESGSWRSLARSPAERMEWQPAGVDDAGTLYVSRLSAASTSVLARFDFATGKPEPQPIASAPGFDLDGGLVMDQGKLVGIRVVTDAETTTWLDPRRKLLQVAADERLPNGVNRTSCSDCFGNGAMLVLSYSDRDPGSYWLYRPQSQKWQPIGRSRPAVDPRQMALLDMHRIQARDGQDLPVWVTTPPAKAGGPRPAVVLVHGGPWVRGTDWRWDETAQFLASRGYVVIEPEYRSSTGYGDKLFRSGWKQWGTTMQDDVADAVRWAADKGMIDLKRVCIVGGSYGGYAALMGPIRTPDLYRCGVAYVAVTDPRLLFANTWASDISREGREFSMPLMIGDLEKDAAMLKAAAPVERAGEIRIPMLLAFGGKDRRVPIEHGTRIRAAMRAAGQEPQWIVYDDEGHGWLKVEHRIDFWQRVEAFLAKNLQQP